MAFPTNPNPGDEYTDEFGTVWVYAGPINGWYRKTVLPDNDTTYTGGGSGSATAAGAAGEIQYTDGTNLAASADLSWDDVAKELTVGGDIDLNDGGTYSTTLQTITPTADRVISFPDATGTLALVAGSSGQLIYNSAGANAGVQGSIIGATGDVTLSLAGAASTPPLKLTGTWFTGGTATTTKPQVLIEPAGTTSTAWSTSGTGLGVNAASGFAGNLLDLQVDGTSRVTVNSAGTLTVNSNIALGGVTDAYIFSNRGRIDATADGVFRLLVNAQNSFNRLAFGLATSVFPSLKRNGAVLETKLADDSAYAQHAASVFEAATAHTVAGLPGTPTVGMIARVTDASAPVVGFTVAGGGAAAALVWWNGSNWTVIGV